MSSLKKEILRYCIVTPFVGLTDFGVYFLSLKFLPISVSKGIAFFMAAVLGYYLNKHWTFVKHDRSPVEMGRYGLIQIILLLFNVGANKVFLILFPGALLGAMVAASISSAVLSFICKKFWVFR